MAISIVNGITNGFTTNLTSYTTASFTPAAGEFLLVLVHATDIAIDGTLSDSLGLGWTKLAGIVSNSTNRFVAFISNMAAAAAAMTVTWDCSAAGNASGCLFGVMRLAGTDGLVRQITNNSGAGGAAPSVSLTRNSLTTSAVVIGVANLSNPHGNTPPTNYTTRAGGAYSTPTAGLYAAARNSGETGNTVTNAGNSASAWTTFGIEIFASGIGVTHNASGTLNGQGSTLSGSAKHKSKHTASGILSGQGAAVNSTSRRYTQHNASGGLTGAGSLISSACLRYRLHQASGILLGSGAELSGQALRAIDTPDIKIPSSIEITADYLEPSIQVDLAQPAISVSYETQSIEVNL